MNNRPDDDVTRDDVPRDDLGEPTDDLSWPAPDRDRPPASSYPPPAYHSPGVPPPPDLVPEHLRRAPDQGRAVRVVLWVVVALVLLGAGGVGAFVWLILDSTRPYVDVANEYLTAVRADDVLAASSLRCDARVPEHDLEDLGGGRSQDLTSVEVSNGDGRVSGTVVLSDGNRHQIELAVLDRGGRLCVADVHVFGAG